jgi:hypothetical protein
MFNDTEEYIWQFEAPNGGLTKDNGHSYFGLRANERAMELGCHVVGLKNVKLDFLRGRWKVTGTAVLKKMQATG